MSPQTASLLYLQKQPHFLNQNLKGTTTPRCPKQRCILESGSESNHKLVGHHCVHSSPGRGLPPHSSGQWGLRGGGEDPSGPSGHSGCRLCLMPSWFQKIGCQGELFPVDQHGDFKDVLFLLLLILSALSHTLCQFLCSQHCGLIYRQTLKWIRGYSWRMCRAYQGLSSATWPWVPTLLGLFWPQSPPHWTQRWGGE